MKFERYIIVNNNEWVVRSNDYGFYRYVSLSDPDVLNKAFIFKTVSSAKRSLRGGRDRNNSILKIVKISGELKLGDEIDK